MAGGGARRGARGGVAEPSEQEVLGVMMRGHDSMMAVLTARQRALQARAHQTLTSNNVVVTRIGPPDCLGGSVVAYATAVLKYRV